MLFSTVKSPVITAADFNHNLAIINHWAHQWKMEFNPDPTKQATQVLFSCKKVGPNIVTEKIIKAKQNIGIIKHLSNLPVKTLSQMYKALIRSHLDYCDIICHIPPKINPPSQFSTFDP